MLEPNLWLVPRRFQKWGTVVGVRYRPTPHSSVAPPPWKGCATAAPDRWFAERDRCVLAAAAATAERFPRTRVRSSVEFECSSSGGLRISRARRLGACNGRRIGYRISNIGFVTSSIRSSVSVEISFSHAVTISSLCSLLERRVVRDLRIAV